MELDICAYCGQSIEFSYLMSRWARTNGYPANPWVCINAPLNLPAPEHAPSYSVG